MKKSLLYLFIICILHSFLLYGQSLGLNVILFTIPLLIFIYHHLKSNNLIKNKKGLLYMIPIIVLSAMNLVYDNTFTDLNIMIIPGLYILMFVYTINPTNNLATLLIHMLRVVFKPLDKLSAFIKEIKEVVGNYISIDETKKKKIKSLIIVIPIVILVLALLSSADMIFGDIFNKLFDVIDDTSIYKLIGRAFRFILIFVYLGITLFYVKDMFPNEKSNDRYIKAEEYTVKLLLTILNVIYVVFDIIQIHSLMLHHVGDKINYAEYARSGFFQLMFISVLNIAIILISKQSKKNKYNQAMSIVMVFLTFIIIVSSFLRMHLYEVAYGYTALRLGVYIILVTEAILLIPTIIYILKDKFPILRCYIAISVFVYTFVNLFSIDDIITNNNLNRYYKTGKLDVYYLENSNYDNIPQLVELYENVTENEDLEEHTQIKIALNYYLKEQEIDMNTLLEYNMAKKEAKDALNSIVLEEEVEYNYIDNEYTGRYDER